MRIWNSIQRASQIGSGRSARHARYFFSVNLQKTWFFFGKPPKNLIFFALFGRIFDTFYNMILVTMFYYHHSEKHPHAFQISSNLSTLSDFNKPDHAFRFRQTWACFQISTNLSTLFRFGARFSYFEKPKHFSDLEKPEHAFQISRNLSTLFRFG